MQTLAAVEELKEVLGALKVGEGQRRKVREALLVQEVLSTVAADVRLPKASWMQQAEAEVLLPLGEVEVLEAEDPNLLFGRASAEACAGSPPVDSQLLMVAVVMILLCVGWVSKHSVSAP